MNRPHPDPDPVRLRARPCAPRDPARRRHPRRPVRTMASRPRTRRFRERDATIPVLTASPARGAWQRRAPRRRAAPGRRSRTAHDAHGARRGRSASDRQHRLEDEKGPVQQTGAPGHLSACAVSLRTSRQHRCAPLMRTFPEPRTSPASRGEGRCSMRDVHTATVRAWSTTASTATASVPATGPAHLAERMELRRRMGRRHAPWRRRRAPPERLEPPVHMAVGRRGPPHVGGCVEAPRPHPRRTHTERPS